MATNSAAKTPTRPPALELCNISAWRGETEVFTDLSLIIGRGESAAIIGPNGAGKTTLLKLLNREIYPVKKPASVMRLFGQERWNVWTLRQSLGLVSADLQHHYATFATGFEVVISGFFASSGIYKHQNFTSQQLSRGRRVMVELGISLLAQKRFDTMSTGEQRRCLLARSLVHDPEVLIMDEPTSGLDLRATFQYLDTMRQLIRQGRSLILVTHHVHEIPPEINRVILLDAGRLVADGEKSAILNDETLSQVFAVNVKVLQSGGYYQVVPAQDSAY